MSANFKSFLKGLLNKVPQSRLAWPALLEHPFVKDDSMGSAAESRPAPFEARGSEGTRKAEETQTSRNQPSSAAPQSRTTATNRDNDSDKPKGNGRLDGPMQATQDRHGSPTGAVPESCSPSECTALDKLEKASQTVEGANSIVIMKQCQPFSALSKFGLLQVHPGQSLHQSRTDLVFSDGLEPFFFHVYSVIYVCNLCNWASGLVEFRVGYLWAFLYRKQGQKIDKDRFGRDLCVRWK